MDGSAHGAPLGDDPIFEAGGGIINVEAEYRLGIFGMAHPAIPDTGGF